MILNKFFIFLTILAVNLNPSLLENKCVFRGKCGEFESSLGGVFPIPCVHNDDPQPLKNETVSKLLKSIAPELFTIHNWTVPMFCCDEQQIIDISEQISTVHAFVQNCPSCFVNFAKIFYHMTCAPNQIDFIDITSASNSTLRPGQQQVDQFTYYVSESFVESVYNSCKSVQMPSAAGVKAMALLCGQWGAQDCTAQRFLNFVGTKDPSPMQIDFVFTKETVVHKTNSNSFYPLNPKTFSCSEAPIGYANNTCTCNDCPAKCT